MMTRNIRRNMSHKYISCLLVVSMLFSMLPFHAFAMPADIINYGQVGESVYAELTEDGVLVLSGTGDTYDYSPDSPAPWYAARASILSAEIENGITSLGDYLFYNCEDLTGKLLLPESLISIGECAFSGDDFMTAPKLRAVINEFSDTEILTDVASEPHAPAPDRIYSTNPDADIPTESDSASTDSTQPVDEAITGGESPEKAPPADADDEPSDEPPVSNEPGSEVEPGNEEPVDAPSDESPEEGPDTVTIGDSLPPLAAVYMDSGEEPLDEETANSSDDEPAGEKPAEEESVEAEPVSEPEDKPSGESGPSQEPIKEPAVGESSVERESVLLTKQRIGADAFFPGQSGAYYCTDENVSFIDAMEAAGYIRASALVPVTYTDSSGNQYAAMGLLTEHGLLLEDFRKSLDAPRSDALQVYSFIGWTLPSEKAPVEETPIDDVSRQNENAAEPSAEPVMYGAWSFAPYEKENPYFTACFALTARQLAERALEKELGEQRITLTGNLPENAELSVEVISLSDAEALINGHLEGEAHPSIHFAYDITLLVDGQKYQPADYGESVRIRIENAALPENGGSLSILHIKDDDTAEDLTVESVSESAVEFTADSFSPIVGYSLTSTVWDGTTDTTWYNTTDAEFTITTAEQLAGLAAIVRGYTASENILNSESYLDSTGAQIAVMDSFAGKAITLGADISLGGKSWFPIGQYSSYPFSGIFDGAGHAVVGLSNTGYLDPVCLAIWKTA